MCSAVLGRLPSRRTSTTDAEADILNVVRYERVLRGLYDRRYDFNADGSVDILDVLLYKWLINTSCANP